MFVYLGFGIEAYILLGHKSCDSAVIIASILHNTFLFLPWFYFGFEVKRYPLKSLNTDY